MSSLDGAAPIQHPHALEAAVLAGWPSAVAANAQLTLLAGGATGRTFKLTGSADGDAPAPTPVVVRSIRVGGEDAGLVAASRALAEEGLTPAVLASSATLQVSTFVDANPVAVTSLAAGGENLQTVAFLVGRLHSLDVALVGDARPAREDELALWLGWAEASIPELGAKSFEDLRAQAAACNAFRALRGPAGTIVVGHGDLHPGNLLLETPTAAAILAAADADSAGVAAEAPKRHTQAWLVDLEHLCPRRAADDIAYFFAVWGDLLYMSGWRPSPGRTVP
jgi:hypothetical protein